MQKVEVAYSPALFSHYDMSGKIVVVVDILRATSIICTMFENGLKELIPVKTLEEAKYYKQKGFLVAAERDGSKVDFADFGNSPFEFTTEKIQGKTIVYSTTNGTNTINLAKESDELILASFLNLSKTVDLLAGSEKDILILCSGWEKDYCLEDAVFAGALISKLKEKKKLLVDSDPAIASMELWGRAETGLQDFMKKAFQYERLKTFGMDKIFQYCFNIDTLSVIPMLKGDLIVEKNNFV